MKNPFGWAVRTFIWEPAHMAYSSQQNYVEYQCRKKYYAGVRAGIIIGRRIAAQEQKEFEENA